MLQTAPVTVTQHPPGLPHVRATIKKMADLARKGMHSYPIRNLATRITRNVPSKDYRGELEAIYRWVRDTIRYRKDPWGLEWVQSPERTVKERAGDCDDITTLLAALAGALGHEWLFDTVGETPTMQSHVAVVVKLGNEQLTLDPVLEPAINSTAPRADLGTFGLHAHGAHHRWSMEGKMLGFMGSPVNARDRRLWDWNPYYPPVGVGLKSGMQPAQGGRYTSPALPYRMAGAPGFQHGRSLATMRHMDHSQLLSGGELGSFLSALKKVAKAAGKVVHVAGKVARSPIIKAIPLPAAQIISRAGEAEGQAEHIYGQVKHVVQKGKKAVKAGVQLASQLKQPHPELRKKYPSNARQVFDAKHSLFRIYVPAGNYVKPKGMHGLGALRPVVSFSLGAASASSASSAVAAVRAYITAHKSPPTVAVAAVRAFQVADGALTVDGKWGPNSRLAAAWYLDVAESSLPAFASAFAKTKITWHPPVQAAPPAPSAPAQRAPAPVVTAAAPTPARAAPPAPSTSSSAGSVPLPGYTEVGHESANPGLPPVAATPSTTAAAASAAPVRTATPVATPVRVATATPVSVSTPATPKLVQVTPASAPKKKTKKAALPPGAAVVLPKAGAGVDAQTVVMTSGGPVLLPPPLLPAGPGPGGVDDYRARMSDDGGAGGDNTLLWVAIGYLWYQQQQKRKHAQAA